MTQEAADELSRRISAYVAELLDTRMQLDSDQLVNLASPRARMEVKLDAVDAYIFTVDGVLQGKKIEGAMFAGEVMLIRAKDERSAQEMANAGVRETVKLLHEEYETRHLRDSQIIAVDAAGRRARPSEGEPLAKLPELRQMLRNAFEKK